VACGFVAGIAAPLDVTVPDFRYDRSAGRERDVKTKCQLEEANRIWRWMLAIDCAIVPALFFYKLFYSAPQIGYIHLLATYHFGFARRALVGTIVSWFINRVPIWYVYAIGGAAWIATVIMFVVAFRKIFGLSEKTFSLFVFMIGSPFFFKNFMYGIEYFDIYGCLLALVALVIPVGLAYPLVIGAGCVCLILMHHIHFLLYVPTIAFIALVRYGLLPGISKEKVACGVIAASVLSVVFMAAAYFGRMPVPQETFLAYVSARAADALDPSGTNIWYSTIAQEVEGTWAVMWRNSARIPIYAALIAAHTPVARCLWALIGNLSIPFHRTTSILGIGSISIGYLVISLVVFDYSRWVSNWAVCMFLLILAIRLLPSTSTDTDVPIRPDNLVNLVLAWTVTVIPRVGITKPF